MATQTPMSPAARIFFGLFCIACGTPPALSAFDIGPFSSADINGPPWLGLLAGGVFIAVGIAMLLGNLQRSGPGSYILFSFVLAALTAIANWIAFGPGPRACTIAFAGFFFESDSWANGLACRAGFGIGAAMLDGFMLWMVAKALRDIIGEGPLPNAIEKLGIAFLILAVAPIFLPLLIFPFGRALLEGFRVWRKTGAWPRNEEFIARMKAKSAEKP